MVSSSTYASGSRGRASSSVTAIAPAVATRIAERTLSASAEDVAISGSAISRTTGPGRVSATVTLKPGSLGPT